jgi:hypothetical protein
LDAAGACDLVAKALAIHKHDEAGSVACCMAATVLSEFNFDHKSALKEAGICGELDEILPYYVSNQEPAVWTTKAMALLALETDNNVLLSL